MKITIAPTSTEKGYRTVTVEEPSDDLAIDDLMTLIEGAVLAFGYHQNTIDDYWGRGEDE